MKLKEKLAFNYAEREYNMYGTSGEGTIAERAFIAGFQKARELAVEVVKDLDLGDGDYVWTELNTLGEEKA